MGSTTMTAPFGIPTTIDVATLSMSLSDYQKRLVDNIYNTNVILKLANEAGNKKMINGGNSINKMVEFIKNLAKSVDIRFN
jgi:hypothetical protein